MSYMEQVCRALIDTLERTSRLDHEDLAGHAANIAFWVSQAANCLEVIDGYRQRFDRLRAAGPVHSRGIQDHVRKNLRRELDSTVYRFIVRCHNEGFVDRPQLDEIAQKLGMSIATPDLRNR